MTTQRHSFDERLSLLETEVADIKGLLGESARVQAQMLNLLNLLGGRMQNLEGRIEDIARHLDVPRPNGSA